MQREITFTESYKLARRAKLNPVAAAIMAMVWVLRGDKITVDE